VVINVTTNTATVDAGYWRPATLGDRAWGAVKGNQLTAVWTEAPAAYARRWNGTSWVALGGSAAGSGLSGTSAVAEAVSSFRANGEVAVAWADLMTTPRTIRLLAWDGGAWGEWAGSLTQGLGAGDRPSVLYDGADALVVAWDAPADGGVRTVESARWDGVAWQPLPAVTGIKANLARDSRNHVLMATEVAVDGGSTIALYASTPTGWETCPLTGITTQSASWPELAVGPGDSLVLGWFEGTGGQLRSHAAFLIRDSTTTGAPPRTPRRDLDVGCACGSAWSVSPAALLLVVLRAAAHRRRRG